MIVGLFGEGDFGVESFLTAEAAEEHIKVKKKCEGLIKPLEVI